MPSDPLGAPRTTPCPSCGAALRPGSPWCTLCYTDLRPKPAGATNPGAPGGVPTTAPPNAAYGQAAPDPLTQPLIDFIPLPEERPATATSPVRRSSVLGTWPCTACGSPNPLETQTCQTCGAGFLAGSVPRPSYVLPIVGDIGRFSRGQRIAAAVVVALLVILPIAVITALLASPTTPASDPRSPLPTGYPTQPPPAPTFAPTGPPVVDPSATATPGPAVPGGATPSPTALPTAFPTASATP